MKVILYKSRMYGRGVGLGKWNQESSFREANLKSPPGYIHGGAEKAINTQVPRRERSGLQTQSCEVPRDGI